MEQSKIPTDLSYLIQYKQKDIQGNETISYLFIENVENTLSRFLYVIKGEPDKVSYFKLMSDTDAERKVVTRGTFDVVEDIDIQAVENLMREFERMKGHKKPEKIEPLTLGYICEAIQIPVSKDKFNEIAAKFNPGIERHEAYLAIEESKHKDPKAFTVELA